MPSNFVAPSLAHPNVWLPSWGLRARLARWWQALCERAERPDRQVPYY